MVVGTRQIGKTYLIDEFCKNKFEDYIYINLDKSEDIQSSHGYYGHYYCDTHGNNVDGYTHQVSTCPHRRSSQHDN